MFCIGLFQFYSIGHIIYCKWDHYKKEKAQRSHVPSFLVELNHIESACTQTQSNRSSQNAHAHDEIKFNNSSYNKVLVEASHIFTFIAFVIIRLVLRQLRQSFTDTNFVGNLEELSRLNMYICDLTPSILISFVFPLIFYLTHPKIRNYMKGIFSKQTL